MATDKDPVATIVPVNITRGLTDKLVEKRKGAALELERSLNTVDHSHIIYTYIPVYIVHMYLLVHSIIRRVLHMFNNANFVRGQFNFIFDKLCTHLTLHCFSFPLFPPITFSISLSLHLFSSLLCVSSSLL